MHPLSLCPPSSTNEQEKRRKKYERRIQRIVGWRSREVDDPSDLSTRRIFDHLTRSSSIFQASAEAERTQRSFEATRKLLIGPAPPPWQPPIKAWEEEEWVSWSRDPRSFSTRRFPLSYTHVYIIQTEVCLYCPSGVYSRGKREGEGDINCEERKGIGIGGVSWGRWRRYRDRFDE